MLITHARGLSDIFRLPRMLPFETPVRSFVEFSALSIEALARFPYLQFSNKVHHPSLISSTFVVMRLLSSKVASLSQNLFSTFVLLASSADANASSAMPQAQVIIFVAAS